MKIVDIMNSDVKTCTEQDSLNRAAQLMWESDIGAVPVVDAEHRPVGMVTDRDICMAAYTQGERLSAIPVASAMARHLTTCQANDSVEKVEQRMCDRQIRRMPVLHADKLVGIVSLNDIALAASARRQSQVSFDEVGKTVAAICQHRGAQATSAVA